MQRVVGSRGAACRRQGFLGRPLPMRMRGTPRCGAGTALSATARDPRKQALVAGVDYKIRRGLEADAADIGSLVLAERMNPLGLDPARFWVAVDRQGQVLGIVQLQAISLGSSFHELRSTVVRSEYRNLGVGAALVKEALASLPEDEPVWLVTGAWDGCRCRAGACMGRHGCPQLPLGDGVGAVPRSAGFFMRLGFEPVYETTELPTTIWFERFAGQFVAQARELAPRRQASSQRLDGPGCSSSSSSLSRRRSWLAPTRAWRCVGRGQACGPPRAPWDTCPRHTTTSASHALSQASTLKVMGAAAALEFC